MAPSHPTLINLPPPPSDPVTPSDIPGTPNSTTTTMSELSTVAIKDGHRGHLPHNSRQAAQPDAERADRISRLAGLERVATARQPPSTSSNPAYGGSGGGYGTSGLTPGPGYFDPSGNPQMQRERSTVGSASATGSMGGRTTWASGSDVYDPSSATDKMSDTQDTEMDMLEGASVGGMSDEQNSLVGFGEGARTPARQSGGAAFGAGSPALSKAAINAPLNFAGGAPGAGHREASLTPVSAGTGMEQQHARMIDGQSVDGFDTSGRGGLRGSGHADAERYMRERLGPGGSQDRVMESPGSGQQELGRFEWEKK